MVHDVNGKPAKSDVQSTEMDTNDIITECNAPEIWYTTAFIKLVHFQGSQKSDYPVTHEVLTKPQSP